MSEGRQLILHMSVSLDGFVERRDGVADWLGGDGGRIPDHWNLPRRRHPNATGPCLCLP
jgi:hypothetical protein